MAKSKDIMERPKENMAKSEDNMANFSIKQFFFRKFLTGLQSLESKNRSPLFFDKRMTSETLADVFVSSPWSSNFLEQLLKIRTIWHQKLSSILRNLSCLYKRKPQYFRRWMSWRKNFNLIKMIVHEIKSIVELFYAISKNIELRMESSSLKSRMKIKHN